MITNIYNLATKYIESHLGKKETSATELHDISRKIFGGKFSGVYPSDKARVSSKKPYAIVNVDTSNELGSHWVAMIKDGDILFYDSFGRPSSKLMPNVFNGGRNIVNTEDDCEQNIKETNCGQRSISAIFIFDQFGRDAFLSL